MRTLKLVLTLSLVMALSLRVGLAFLPSQGDAGPGGAGALSWWWLLALLPLLVWRARRRAALGDDQDAAVSPPEGESAARGPEVPSGMRLPRTARSVRSVPMRVPRLSMRN